MNCTLQIMIGYYLEEDSVDIFEGKYSLSTMVKESLLNMHEMCH